jgi:hypothetical protein
MEKQTVIIKAKAKNTIPQKNQLPKQKRSEKFLFDRTN